jgi:hypothetical protein
MTHARHLKRAIIKEELVELTGNYVEALILNQFIYWSQRVKDFDKFIAEEYKRSNGETKIDPTQGWIYKTASELSDELMLGMSDSTIRRYMKNLIDNEWINQRTNPKHMWDRTLQYRVNIFKVQSDLHEIGYFLDGYPLPNFQNENSMFQNENSTFQNERAIPEITTKITTEVKEPPKCATTTADRDLDADMKAAQQKWNRQQKGLPTSNRYGQMQIAEWNMELPAKERIPIAEAIAQATGKLALWNAGDDKLHVQMHESAIKAHKMGYTAERIEQLTDTWRDNWRAKGGGSVSQFLEFLSEQTQHVHKTERKSKLVALEAA